MRVVDSLLELSEVEDGTNLSTIVSILLVYVIPFINIIGFVADSCPSNA